MRSRSPLASLSLFVASVSIVATAACGGGGEQKSDSAAAPAAQPEAAAPAAGGPQEPDAGGQVIKVEMTTDEQGNNKFTPSDFEAKKGDVIRYTLVQGVHNAHFLPDSNPGKQGLPAAGPLLQAPGQTFDVKVTFEPGRYYFQCDPHALLGMVGHVTVK